MNYFKAEQVLPAELLAEIQRYVPSSMLYIAKPGRARRKWGELSGERRRLDERNRQIRRQHKQGSSIASLAEEYHLSVETIKKIAYRR